MLQINLFKLKSVLAQWDKNTKLSTECDEIWHNVICWNRALSIVFLAHGTPLSFVVLEHTYSLFLRCLEDILMSKCHFLECLAGCEASPGALLYITLIFHPLHMRNGSSQTLLVSPVQQSHCSPGVQLPFLINPIFTAFNVAPAIRGYLPE